MPTPSPTSLPVTRTQQLLDAMQFRCIGPSRGGRVIAVAGDPSKLATFYFGAVAGGVWKTEDAGATWQNMSDGFFKTASVGALTVSNSDPNVIYAGMGESTIRTDVSHGDGVYKSTDGGKTWRHMGLEQTRHIGEIRIHPKNPDHVYVAALGHAFGPNEERGLYRSTNGGANWQKILFKSNKAGVVDVSFDPHNPQVIYASVWEAHRNFWELSSGGADSGLWKSTDGGETWSDISRAKGLPHLWQDRRLCLTGAGRPRLGTHGGQREAGALPLRRFWRHVDAAHRPAGLALSPLVLHARLCRPAGCRHGLCQ